MRIVYFGSSEFGIPSLQALQDSAKRIVHIFTQPAHRAGRGRKPRPTPVHIWAEQNGVPVTEAENINAPEVVEHISALKADLLVVIAFGQKIGPEIIGLFPKGAINVHGSLLPEYRGAAPINKAIIDGKTETGITIITLADRMDAGLMLADARVPIDREDNAQTLHDKLAALAPLTLLETVDRLSVGSAVFTEQDESKVTFAHKMKKSDGYIDFSEPAEQLFNKIRGMWPWPGAHAHYVCGRTGRCYETILARAEVVPHPDNPGTYGKLDDDLNVICGRDRLRIHELKPAGGKLMSFEAFARGRSIQPGDIFIPVEG